MKTIVFWICMPSPHLAHFLVALNNIPDVKVLPVYEAHTEQWRIQSGFDTYSSIGNETFLDCTDWEKIVEQLLCQNKNAIHVFGGFAGYPRLSFARKSLIKMGLSFYIISETGDGYDPFFNLKNIIRKIRMMLIWFKNRRLCRGVFCIGEKASDYYKAIGVPRNKLFPFIYTIQNDNAILNKENNQIKSISIVFVGRLIPLKGLDILLKAMRLLPSGKYNLDIIGDGPEKNALCGLIKKLCLTDNVRFLGRLSNTEVLKRLGTYSLLVIPSRYDGWAAVVNESIAAGVPVISSEAVGAKDLIRFGNVGAIFPANNSAKLAQAIETVTEKNTYAKLKENCSSYRQKITPESVANYFFQACTTSSVKELEIPWQKL